MDQEQTWGMEEHLFDVERLRERWARGEPAQPASELSPEAAHRPPALSLLDALKLTLEAELGKRFKLVEPLLAQAHELLSAQLGDGGEDALDDEELAMNRSQFAEVLNRLEDILEALEYAREHARASL
ncbi:hypothetical protein ACFL59_04605 [Planctomycetota bacterium]